MKAPMVSRNAFRWLAPLVLALYGAGLPVVAAPSSLEPEAPTFAAPAGYVVHGVHLNPVLDYKGEIANFETAVGKQVGIVMYFLDWNQPLNLACSDGFLPNQLYLNDPNLVPMISWQPFIASSFSEANPGPADYDLVLSGAYDSYIEACANRLSIGVNAGKPIIIRLMHEMNLVDSPWWAGKSFNQKADGTGDTEKFKQVWRYLVDRFRAEGAVNVQWLWAPNYASNPADDWNDMHRYYPGDAYVDWVGLSGYNWNGINGRSPAQSYFDLYDAALTDLQCRYARPIVHAEIGSAQYVSGSADAGKAAWITDAYTRLQTYPLLRAVTWFNDYAFHNTDQADFRVWTNTNSGYGGSAPYAPVPANVTAAYSAAVGASAFTASFNSAELLNPPMTRCPGDVVSGNGVLSARPAVGLVGRQGATTTGFTVGALGLSANTVFTVSGCPANVTCVFASSGAATSASRPRPWSADTLAITAGASGSTGSFTLTISGGGASVDVTLAVSAQLNRLHLPLVSR